MCTQQAEWREEVKQHFEKIKSEGTCLHRLDEELINRRREELRSVFHQDLSGDLSLRPPVKIFKNSNLAAGSCTTTD